MRKSADDRPRRSSPEKKVVIARAGLRRELRVVGIGASAGGLEALELFFGNVPADTPLAFAVVLGLSLALLPWMPARATPGR